MLGLAVPASIPPQKQRHSGGCRPLFRPASGPVHPAKTMPEIVTEMLEAKKTDGFSELYLKDLRWRLKPFAEAFGGWVGNILSGELDD
jgi:hypothetical protein